MSENQVEKRELVPVLNSVKCTICQRRESEMWHRVLDTDEVKCNMCQQNQLLAEMKIVIGIDPVYETKPTLPTAVVAVVAPDKPKPMVRKAASKNTRNYKTRQNPNATPKQGTPKGKSRRALYFKKNPPVRLQAAPSEYTTCDHVFHKGFIWRIGDIVSCQDVEGGTFYAQIKGLMKDQYCQASVSISWLIPTRCPDIPYPRPGFDPATFVYGTDDDLPRDIECFEFVMHCPSDYFRAKTPFPTGIPPPTEAGFIWTRLKPQQNPPSV